MKRTYWLFDIILLVVIFVLHEWTKRVMADSNVVASLLSAGQHLPATSLIAAISFIILRFVVVVVIPAIMIGRWAFWLAGHALGLKGEEDEDNDLRQEDTIILQSSQSAQPPPSSIPWLFK